MRAPGFTFPTGRSLGLQRGGEYRYAHPTMFATVEYGTGATSGGGKAMNRTGAHVPNVSDGIGCTSAPLDGPTGQVSTRPRETASWNGTRDDYFSNVF